MSTPASNAAIDNDTMKPSGNSFTVMFIDDNTLLIDALERRLHLVPGFSGMFRVSDFTKSVEEVVMARPTIVLLDVDIPGGVDAEAILAGIVRSAPDSRVIMCTGHPSSALIGRTMAAGAWGFISKGASSNRLIEGILRVVGGEAVIELED